MIDADKGPWKYLVMWLRFYYAIHFLKSGINYAVFGVIPVVDVPVLGLDALASVFFGHDRHVFLRSDRFDCLPQAGSSRHIS